MRHPTLLRPIRLALAVAVGWAAFSPPLPASAGPWIAPGDGALRHDLQRLHDGGVLPGPSLSWPLSRADVARDIGGADEGALPAGTRAALLRVRSRLAREGGANTPTLSARLSLGVDPSPIRTFDDSPREDVQASLALDGTGGRFAWGLHGTFAGDPEDGKEWRTDGSFAAAALGNWELSLGSVERWWGPGWDGSLLLSTNARPVPAIAIERRESTPPDAKALRWIGPWRLAAFLGRLEGDRDPSRPLLLGLRVEARPLPPLQLAASRAMQFCGHGRPCSPGTFREMLAGDDNDQPAGEQPGNQLAALDLRLAWPGGGVPAAFYAQAAGEDEAGFLPYKYIGLAGIEAWGDAFGRSWRVHGEYANTACGFLGSRPRYGTAYESAVYREGYRYRGRSIGHSIDSDGDSLGIGGRIVDNGGREWRLRFRSVRLDRAGRSAGNSLADGPAEVRDLEVAHRLPFGPGTVEAAAGYAWTGSDRGAALSVDGGFRGSVTLRYGLP